MIAQHSNGKKKSAAGARTESATEIAKEREERAALEKESEESREYQKQLLQLVLQVAKGSAGPSSSRVDYGAQHHIAP